MINFFDDVESYYDLFKSWLGTSYIEIGMCFPESCMLDILVR